MADSYSQWLREDLTQMTSMLELTSLQKHYVLSRWLEQVVWMEHKAIQSRDRHFLLSRTTLIGGAIVPALVGLNAFTGVIGDVVYWLIFFISLTVAVAGVLERFHNYSERWRHYRSIVEELKIIGWQFFQLAGRFQDYTTHREAYIAFVNTVEEIIQKEVEVYVSSVIKDRPEDTNQPPQNHESPPAAYQPLPQEKDRIIMLS